MDVYAVRSADLTAVAKESPVQLKVIGRVAAGEKMDGEVIPGTACDCLPDHLCSRGRCCRDAGRSRLESSDLVSVWDSAQAVGRTFRLQGGRLSKAGAVWRTRGSFENRPADVIGGNGLFQRESRTTTGRWACWRRVRTPGAWRKL